MSNDTKTYNGWTNYETWCVHLWSTNEQATYSYILESAQRCLNEAPSHPNVKQGIWSVEQAARYTLGEELRAAYETYHPFRGEHLAKPMEADVYCDLLDAALSEVRWSEIAEAFLEGLEPEGEPDPEGEPTDETEDEPAASEGPKQDQAGGPKGPRFELGRVVSTPGALAAVTGEDIAKALARHHQGDWGDVGPVDWQMNEMALEGGDRLFSVYYALNGVKIWVITEADRSATTVLLPDEY